jgi:hypothetical protein
MYGRVASEIREVTSRCLFIWKKIITAQVSVQSLRRNRNEITEQIEWRQLIPEKKTGFLLAGFEKATRRINWLLSASGKEHVAKQQE